MVKQTRIRYKETIQDELPDKAAFELLYPEP